MQRRWPSTLRHSTKATEAREFYEFLKTMETLETTLSKNDTLIFSTDSDFFRYLKRSNPTKE